MTRAAEKLSARAEELPDGSLRRRALEGARRFKSAWVDFARLLVEVRASSAWREWGYASFEAYCGKELFIRKSTVEKLTLSYGFLERHEPDLARSAQRAGGREEPRPPPAFEVIEVLSRAEQAGRLRDAAWRELRDEVLEAPSAAAVSRRLDEHLGPAPQPPPPAERDRLARLAAVARRLADGCQDEEAVPDALTQRAAALARELSRLVEQVEE